jgi:type I restriction enzyme S subunit
LNGDSSHKRKRLKFLAHVEMGQSPPSTAYSSTEFDGLPFLQGSADFGSKFPEPRIYCSSPTKVADIGNILFSVRAPVGVLNKVNQKVGIGRGLCAIQSGKSLDERFAWWALHEARGQLNYVSTGSTYEAVSTEDVANLLLPTITIDQQQTIADYLDNETTKLDAMLAAKQRLLYLLEEKRRVLITCAVTRGLNPHAQMKDSGVEWLGPIPKYWNTKRVKYLFRLISEPAPIDNDFELLSLYTEVGVLPRKDIGARGNKATTTDNYWLVKPGDLVVNKLLAWMGAFGVSEYEGVTSPAYDILRPLDGVNSLYYHHLFRCGICFPEFRRRSTGIMDMRLRLYFDQFGDMRVPVPPVEMQQEIIEHIQRETAKLDTLRIAAERTIGLLKERRVALITAAVTGKLEVNP